MVVGPGVLYMHGQGRAGQPVPSLSPYPPAFPVSKPGHAPLGCLTFVCHWERLRLRWGAGKAGAPPGRQQLRGGWVDGEV